MIFFEAVDVYDVFTDILHITLYSHIKSPTYP